MDWVRGEATIAQVDKAWAAARAAAVAATLRQCAEIVRRHYPVAPTAETGVRRAPIPEVVAPG